MKMKTGCYPYPNILALGDRTRRRRMLKKQKFELSDSESSYGQTEIHGLIDLFVDNGEYLEVEPPKS